MLAARAIEKFKSLQDRSHTPQRLIIALAGVPGSGKTTMAKHVASIITSEQAKRKGPSIVVISMDGFHLKRDELDRMPNREEAYVRRGAPWTFDAKGVVALVRQCRNGINTTIFAPSFDHAAKDPIENGITIPAGTEIVLLEGLYLLLDTDPWVEIADVVDERWYIEVDPEIAKERVAARHVAAGIEPNIRSGRRRVEANDEINGRFIVEHSLTRDIVIPSLSQ